MAAHDVVARDDWRTAARRGVKAAAERLILSSGVPTLARRRRRDAVLVLAYHDIVPEGAAAVGDRSLHLPRAAFAAQLDSLMETHDVVPLAEALGLAPASRPRRRPVAAVTFDDAYRGALTAGLAELRARGLPSTVFVAPAFVGDRDFWWDAVDWPAGTAAGDAFRERALDRWRGEDAVVREEAARLGHHARPLPPHARCVTEDELRHALAAGDLVAGSHSWSHPNLAALDGEGLRRELTLPLDWLRERFANVLPVLAYPYGRWSPRVAEAAREAGYLRALRVDGGWTARDAGEPLAGPRLDVPAGLSTAGFALRASGLFCR